MLRLAPFLLASAALAQDAAPSDRAPLPPILDSWLRVFDGTEHTGYLHETVTSTGRAEAPYEYAVEGAFDVTPARAPATGCRLSALFALSADFSILSGRWQTTYDGAAPIVAVVATDRIGRTLTRSWREGVLELKDGDPLLLAPGPLFLRMRQRGDLSHAVVHSIRSPGDAPAKVGVEAMTDRTVLGKSVRVTPVSVEGAAIDPYSGRMRCWIDRYGRVLEMESATWSMRLSPSSKEAKAVVAGLPYRGRRDPFSREAVLTAPSTPEPTRSGIVLPDPGTDPDAELAAGEAMLKALQESVAAKDDEEAGRRYRRFLGHHVANAPLFTDPARRQAHEDQKAKAERLYGGAQRLLDEATGRVARASDLCEAARPGDIDAELEALRRLGSRPEFFRDPRRSELDAAIVRVVDLRRRAGVRLDLAGKPIALTGVITGTEIVPAAFAERVRIGGAALSLEEPVAARRPVLYAVINDEPYREGAVVIGQGVRVERILRHAVVVSLEGEVREVPFKKE